MESLFRFKLTLDSLKSEVFLSSYNVLFSYTIHTCMQCVIEMCNIYGVSEAFY